MEPGAERKPPLECRSAVSTSNASYARLSSTCLAPSPCCQLSAALSHDGLPPRPLSQPPSRTSPQVNKLGLDLDCTARIPLPSSLCRLAEHRPSHAPPAQTTRPWKLLQWLTAEACGLQAAATRLPHNRPPSLPPTWDAHRERAACVVQVAKSTALSRSRSPPAEPPARRASPV